MRWAAVRGFGICPGLFQSTLVELAGLELTTIELHLFPRRQPLPGALEKHGRSLVVAGTGPANVPRFPPGLDWPAPLRRDQSDPGDRRRCPRRCDEPAPHPWRVEGQADGPRGIAQLQGEGDSIGKTPDAFQQLDGAVSAARRPRRVERPRRSHPGPPSRRWRVDAGLRPCRYGSKKPNPQETSLDTSCSQQIEQRGRQTLVGRGLARARHH